MERKPDYENVRILGSPNCTCMIPIEEQTLEMPEPAFIRFLRANPGPTPLDLIIQESKARRQRELKA